jgi:hypothetical protein
MTEGRIRYKEAPGYVSSVEQMDQAANVEYLQVLADRHVPALYHKHVLPWLANFSDEELEEGIKASTLLL